MKSPRHRIGFVVLAIVGMLFGSGCSRPFWRSQADFDTYNLLQRKQFDPRWNLPRTTVEADARSRFYDPFDPDCAPLPPDDPAASQYMDAVHGMRGYKSWHEFGESMSVENPAWLANFGLAPAAPYVDYGLSDGLTTVSATSPEGMSRSATTAAAEMVPAIPDLSLEQAIELANINSRDYQTQIENAYLSALQLTLDQFQFNVRYLGLGARKPTGTLTNTLLPGTGVARVDSVGFGSRFGMSQLLPTGGQWIVEMANNTLWLFSGGNQTSSASVLSYSLVQPLLLGAGRKIVLENLTLSEREVLYDLRTLARYRKLFFSATVAAGQGANTGGSTGKWEGDMLTITTTHLKMGWIRRNGIPRSDKATVTEHLVRHGIAFATVMREFKHQVIGGFFIICASDKDAGIMRELEGAGGIWENMQCHPDGAWED